LESANVKLFQPIIIIIIIIIIIQYNLTLIYLRANLKGPRPITKLARVNKGNKTQTTETRHLYNNNNNNNNNFGLC
jgi:hypothetical protein